MLTCAINNYKPSLEPIRASREDFKKVDANGTRWVLSFRGPWNDTWKEHDPTNQETYTLKKGRIKL